jgi:ATP-dependent Clp protease ATP-binding subunit ClpC
MTARPTPTLNAFSEDLTLASVYGRTRVLVGRLKEMTALFRAVEGARASVILVGEPGVGKGALLEGLADLMVEEQVPTPLRDKRLVRLSGPRLAAAGAGADERLLAALAEAGRAGNVILVIEDIQDLVTITATNGLDLGSLLARELEKGYVTVLATTTPTAWAQGLERHALGNRLTKVVLNEPERDEAVQILGAAVLYIEAQTNVYFTYAAIAAAVDLSLRYSHEGALPQTAIQLAAEAANAAKRAGQAWVTEEQVGAIITEKTNVPVAQVNNDEAEKLLNLEHDLHARVIGQEAAVSAVSAALRRARVSMRSEKRPIASFLFLGPTGVGKTELAKATAATYFGQEEAMLRFDMSEFQSPDSAERLIGRQGEAGLLTEAVRRRPFALVLLDELEKADAEVLNLFLQVMDDGRLTDGLGRTVDFTNVIIIATSNAGTQYIQDEVKKGQTLAAIKQGLMEQELRGTYRPEFLNRFNEVIVFAPLKLEDVVAISYLMIATIAERLAAKGINFSVSDGAVHELAEAGFDPLYGARPLRRLLEERVENALADALLRGEIARRDTVVYDMGGKLSITKAQSL